MVLRDARGKQQLRNPNEYLVERCISKICFAILYYLKV